MTAVLDLATPARKTEPMRILHVINMGTTCGGAERLVADLAAAQRAAGHAVHVLSSDLAGGGVRFSDTTWPQPVRPGMWRRLTGQISNPAARSALTALLQRWQPDVVHLHTVGLLAPSTLRVLAGTPTVLTMHGPELFLRNTAQWCMPARYFRPGAGELRLSWRGRLALACLSLFIGPLWRRCLRAVDVFVAPSQFLAAITARDFAPTRMVPNGLSPAAPPPRQRTAEPGPPRVVFAGRLEHFKGPQVLLDAVPELLAAYPHARVTICGAGPMLNTLRERVDRLGVGHAVDLTGWLDPGEVARLVTDADVVVIPSMWPEAFGLTCLEASAAGKPVVASAIGALPDLVEPEVNGLLVPPGDAHALAAAIGRLLADEPLRRSLGDGGRRAQRPVRDGRAPSGHARRVRRGRRTLPPRDRWTSPSAPRGGDRQSGPQLRAAVCRHGGPGRRWLPVLAARRPPVQSRPRSAGPAR